MLPNIFGKGLTPIRVSSSPRARRFYLQQGATKKVVFLTGEDEFVNYYEHAIILPNGDREYVLCLKESRGACYLCDLGVKRYWVSVGTILDVDGFTTRDGRAFKYYKMLYAIKYRAAMTLTVYIDSLRREIPNFTLKNSVILITRTPVANSSASGDLFQYSKTLSNNELNEIAEKYGVDLSPYNARDYIKIFEDNAGLKSWYDEIKSLSDESESFEELDNNGDEVKF